MLNFYILVALGSLASLFLAGLSMGYGVWLGYGRLEAKQNLRYLEMYCKMLSNQPKDSE
jgi:hypothetical protein